MIYQSRSNFHYTRCIMPKRVTSCPGPSRVIAPGQHSFFRRNVAAMTSRWQHRVRFDRFEIWTLELPLQKRTRYRSTNWPVIVNHNKPKRCNCVGSFASDQSFSNSIFSTLNEIDQTNIFFLHLKRLNN